MTKLTDSQIRALVEIAAGRVWQWTASESFGSNNRVNGAVVQRLIGRGVAELGPLGGHIARDVVLTSAGHAALQEARG
jgi:hypothetical protein